MNEILFCIGILLLALRFNGSWLPTALRLVGNVLIIIAAKDYADGSLGKAIAIAGFFAVASSFFTIRKRYEDVTIYDGVLILVGIIELIVGCIMAFS